MLHMRMHTRGAVLQRGDGEEIPNSSGTGQKAAALLRRLVEERQPLPSKIALACKFEVQVTPEHAIRQIR